MCSLAIQDEVNWQHKEVVIYGKKVMQPRQVAYMASDTNLSYTYSHTKMRPEVWHPDVAQIKVFGHWCYAFGYAVYTMTCLH